MNIVMIERTVAAVGAVIVFVVAALALKHEWKTPGIENQVFKIMLGLLALGGIIAFLAGIGVLGNFAKGA
ncbi:MAG TPA: hypothetical protein VMS32_09425 [Verrucomicrobiae bacterium]|jgi:uncharacterized membrane protein YphA (DoxX/SURF4 family)|nr:hypothetical protein [Verrucomicrobiae bacterium]